MPRVSSSLARLTLGLGAPFLGACILTLNPAYEDTGEPSSTGREVVTTGGSSAPCPDDQPLRTWYPDGDGDGYGDRQASAKSACDAPDGHVEDHGDCNDKVPEIHPGVKEQCNGYDENCNGVVDDGAPECIPCRIELTKSFVYWLCPDAGISWAEAVDRCAKRSSNKTAVRIASVHDADESALLLALVRDNIKTNKAGEQRAWIGLTKIDAKQSSCDTPDKLLDWRWTDNTPVDFPPPWLAAEPNNMSSLCDCLVDAGCFENCAEIKVNQTEKTAGWNDVLCDTPTAAGYICKTPRDPVLFPGG